MPATRTREDTLDYTREIVPKLKRIFGNENVKEEWDVSTDSRDAFTRKLYCPKLDVAVGPFNIDGNIYNNNQRINEKVDEHETLMHELFNVSETNLGSFRGFIENRNKNPRCFMAIELENSGSRKHMLGDVANASIIGAIGIVVPLNETRLRAFKKIKEYITFATKARKIKASFNNVIVIERNRFIEAISKNL